MRQTKKARKTTRNFRTTKRKLGGMPPRLDPSTIAHLQAKLKKKKEEQSDYLAEHMMNIEKQKKINKRIEAEKAKREAEAAERAREAENAIIAEREEKIKLKAAADAVKAAADAAKVKEAAKRAESVRLAAENAEKKKAEKAAEEAAKEERKRIRAAEAAKVAEEAAAEKERIRLEKKAKRKAAKAISILEVSTNSHLSEKSNSSYASAKSHTSGLSTTDVEFASPEPTGSSPSIALSVKSPLRTESLPTYTIPPIERNGVYDPVFWSYFFTTEEIEELSRDVNCGYIDTKKFFIPDIQEKNIMIGSVLVNHKQAASVNRVVCKLIRIFGIMEARFNERQFDFELIWKGTRAITLATGVLIDTHDIDIEIVNRNGKEESKYDRENRMRLASHICIFIRDILRGAPLSILYPGDQGAVNPDILKMSYMIGSGYIPILDLCFDKTYTIKINKIDTIIADKNEKYIETVTKTGLYKHPSIASMKEEKEKYLHKYTIENKRNDVGKMESGLFKINFALGKITKKPIDMRPKQLTESEIEEKRKLQEIINERLKLSKAKAQSQMTSSNNTASKP